MLPTKITRAAHRATAATPSTACYACLSSQRSHQRRPSSSKASSSADRDSGKGATPATKSASTDVSEPDAASATRAAPRSAKGKPRREYRRVQAGQDAKKPLSAEATDQFAALPSVPSVQSLSESDRSISNFFSLHRPMSITYTFPPPSTPENFSKIFSTEAAQDPWADGNSAERRPEDVIYTLHTTIDNLENGANNAQEEGVRWEIIHESPSNSNNSNSNVHHLDGQPRLRSLEELVAQFKPFRAPPPPQPFPDYEAKQKVKEKKATATTSSAQRSPTKPKQKTFTTTITVTESTYANGQKTYSASSSPIVALTEPETAPQTREERPATRRERVRKLRREASPQAALVGNLVPVVKPPPPSSLRGERMRRMYLISVKRQRRLKMKKHKYKKLMKRTRTLRRRLERN